MTEAEWLACADPKPMLEFLRDKASDRKLRLFAVACCRRVWHLLTSEGSRHSVEAAERQADGLAREEEVAAARFAAGAANTSGSAYSASLHVVYELAYDAAYETAFYTAEADILAHCRSGGPHVRGCWVVDLILGKE